MSTYARSDAEKRLRGTYRDNTHSETNRAKRAISNVLSFPQMKTIPDPTVPLIEGSPGWKSYFKWCDLLLQSNLLTAVSVAHVEQLATADQKLHDTAAKGKLASDKTLEIRRGILLKLDALNVDRALVPDQGKENKFARNGFPARLGKPANNRG